MRAVNEKGLQLLIYHELRRRFASLDEEKLTEKKAARLLLEALQQIPDLKASIDERMQLRIETATGIQYLPVQNIIDGLCVIWNEYRERQRDASHEPLKEKEQ